jgi:hypothetical protein
MPISEFEWYNNVKLLQIFDRHSIITRQDSPLKGLPENDFDSLLGKKINQISILPRIINNMVEYTFPCIEENFLFGECSLDFADEACEAIPIELILLICTYPSFKVSGKNMYLALQEIFETSGLPLHLLKIGMQYLEIHSLVITLKFDNQDILANNYPKLNCNIHQSNYPHKTAGDVYQERSVYQPHEQRSVYQPYRSEHYIERPTKQVDFRNLFFCPWGLFYSPLFLVKATQQPTSILFNNKIRLKLPRILKYIGYYVIPSTKDTIFSLENSINVDDNTNIDNVLLEFEKPLENETVEIISLNWCILLTSCGFASFRYYSL